MHRPATAIQRAGTGRIALMLFAACALLTGAPLAAQPALSSGTVFALLDKSEWCPGGSVYVDIGTGSYLLYPRLPRPACNAPDKPAVLERGVIDGPALAQLRSAFENARSAGLKRRDCSLVISNGGPEALVLTGPAFSAITPEDRGCWSDEATALHETLFRLFGKQR